MAYIRKSNNRKGRFGTLSYLSREQAIQRWEQRRELKRQTEIMRKYADPEFLRLVDDADRRVYWYWIYYAAVSVAAMKIAHYYRLLHWADRSLPGWWSD
jgi:hypothetical protein